MTRFSVPDMSCGHCTAAIEKSLKAADAGAVVVCDLSTRHVDVDSTLPEAGLIEAFRTAGYDASAVSKG